jgi:site-specific recombinase XerD
MRDDAELPRLALSWQRHLHAANRSPKTIRTYLDAVGQLVAFCAERGRATDPVAMDRSDIEAFIGHLLDTRSSSTAATRYRGLQQLFRWLEDEEEIDRSPMAKMKPPSIDEKQVQVADTDDLRALLKACKGSGFTERRDLAIIRFMVDTGARLAETAGLRVIDVDLDRRAGAVAFVVGKGRRERALPMGRSAVRDLDRYLRAREKHSASYLQWLWLGGRSRPDRLTDSGIAQMLRRRCGEAGIAPIHPHQLRHTFAHTFKLAGGNDAELQHLGGWRSPQMLQRYGASAAAERAREAHRRLSPGDRL